MKNEKYLQRLGKLEMLCQTAMKLSIATHGRDASHFREEYGSHTFTKICLTVIAILRLLPKSAYYVSANNMNIWDISSVSTLARSLIDSYNIFYYLIIDEVDTDELEFRFVLWKLHSACERLRMLKLIKSKDSKLNALKQNVEQLTEKLKGTKFCQRLYSEKYQHLGDFISGEKGIFLTNSQISERAGINPLYYKAVYKYLSNYVHTYPFSISQIAAFKAEAPESLELLETIIEYCIAYLSLTIRDFAKVFPDQKSNLTSAIAETIKDSEYIVAFNQKT